MQDEERDALAKLADDVKRSTGGVFDSVKDLSLIMKAIGDQYNMIIPGGAIGARLPLLYSAGVTFVFVDADRETYPIAGEKRLGISKGPLDRIAAAAGIRWNPHLCGRLDDGTNPYVVEYQAAGTVLQLDGTERMIHASKRVDLRAEQKADVATWGTDAQEIAAVAAKKSRDPWPQILQARQHILSLAETKAKNRAIRTLGVRASYEPDELAKGFAIFRLQFTGRSDNPEVEKEISLMIARRALSSSSALFGTEAGPLSPSGTVPKITVSEAEFEKEEKQPPAKEPTAAKVEDVKPASVDKDAALKSPIDGKSVDKDAALKPAAAKPPATAADPDVKPGRPKDDPLLICGYQVNNVWPRKPCSEFTVEELKKKITAVEKKQPKWDPKWAAKNMKDLLAMKAWLAYKELNPEADRGEAFDDYPESGSEDVPF